MQTKVCGLTPKSKKMWAGRVVSWELLVVRVALQRSAVDREFREIREALPTFIPKLSTFPKLIKFPNKAPPHPALLNFLSEGV